MFTEKAGKSYGRVNPRGIEEMWEDMFRWLYENEQDFAFPITGCLNVSGRPQVLATHERFIDWINTHQGVTMDEMNKDFRGGNKSPAQA
nr:glycoside hydrolase deacetylase [Melanopsichium pennsylvanicum 4]